MKLIALSIALCIATFTVAYAHGGGLARDGCHYDRKTMIRHCH